MMAGEEVGIINLTELSVFLGFVGYRFTRPNPQNSKRCWVSFLYQTYKTIYISGTSWKGGLQKVSLS